MKHPARIEIKAGSTLQFTPGGYHLMLMYPKKALRQGDQVEVLLEFQGGLVLPVKLKVSKERP
jgi:copper(I)-binding protein